MIDQTSTISRRRVVLSAAWSMPAIVASTAAPAFAASSVVAPEPVSAAVHLRGGPGNGSRRTYEVHLTLSAHPDTFTVSTVLVAKRTYRPTQIEMVTSTVWRMRLTTEQPLSSNGVLTVSYLSNGLFQTKTLTYAINRDRCAA